VCEVPEMPHRIKIGDTIAYTNTFLDRHSRFQTDMLSAQGKVSALHYLKTGVILADIDWNKPGLPRRVNVKNLTRTKAPALGE
jgi:hypothetical protein